MVAVGREEQRRDTRTREQEGNGERRGRTIGGPTGESRKGSVFPLSDTECDRQRLSKILRIKIVFPI